jgi:hypothetical protein
MDAAYARNSAELSLNFAEELDQLLLRVVREQGTTDVNEVGAIWVSPEVLDDVARAALDLRQDSAGCQSLHTSR